MRPSRRRSIIVGAPRATVAVIAVVVAGFIGVVAADVPTSSSEVKRCDAIEFIIAADGASRRLVDQSSAGSAAGDAPITSASARSAAAFFASDGTTACAQHVARRTYAPAHEESAHGQVVGDTCAAATSRGSGEVCASSSEGGGQRPADVRLDERTKRVARALAGVATAAADAIASMPSASGVVPRNSASLLALLLAFTVSAVGGPMPPAPHAVDAAGVADAMATVSNALDAIAESPSSGGPEDGFPDPPPGEVTWTQVSRRLRAAWQEAEEWDAAWKDDASLAASARRLPQLPETCKRKACMAFEGGVDVGAGLVVAGPVEMGGGASDDLTRLRVVGAPLQTTPIVEVARGARQVLAVTAEGNLRAAGRVHAADARDATTVSDGALSARGGLSVGKSAMIGGRLRVFDDVDAAVAGGGALTVAGGVRVAKSGVFGGGVFVGPPGAKGGPAFVRVRSTDADASLTLATAAKGASAGLELKADARVATVRLEGDTVVITAPGVGAGTLIRGGRGLEIDVSDDVALGTNTNAMEPSAAPEAPSRGALRVAGGVGVGRSLAVGGSAVIGGVSSFAAAAAAAAAASSDGSSSDVVRGRSRSLAVRAAGEGGAASLRLEPGDGGAAEVFFGRVVGSSSSSSDVPSLRVAGALENEHGVAPGSVRLAAAGGGSVALAARGPSGAVEVEGGTIRGGSASGGSASSSGLVLEARDGVTVRRTRQSGGVMNGSGGNRTIPGASSSGSFALTVDGEASVEKGIRAAAGGPLALTAERGAASLTGGGGVAVTALAGDASLTSAAGHAVVAARGGENDKDGRASSVDVSSERGDVRLAALEGGVTVAARRGLHFERTTRASSVSSEAAAAVTSAGALTLRGEEGVAVGVGAGGGGMVLDAGRRRPVVIAGGVVAGHVLDSTPAGGLGGGGRATGLDILGGPRLRLRVGGIFERDEASGGIGIGRAARGGGGTNGGAHDEDGMITAIEVFPKGGGGSAIVKLAAEDLVVGEGDRALVFTSLGPPAPENPHKRSGGRRAAKIATPTGGLDVEAPEGIALVAPRGAVRVAAGGADVDLRARGGARLRLGGGGDDAEEFLVESLGGRVRTTKNDGLALTSGTASVRVSGERGVEMDGGDTNAHLLARGDVSVVGAEGRLTLYGGAGAGLRVGGAEQAGGGGEGQSTSAGGAPSAEVDLPAGGRHVRVSAPEAVVLEAPRVNLTGGATFDVSGPLDLRASDALRVGVGAAAEVVMASGGGGDDDGDGTSGVSIFALRESHGDETSTVAGRVASGPPGTVEDAAGESRWGALLDALDAGGARAGAGLRVSVADASDGKKRSVAEMAADAVRVTSARGGARITSRDAMLRLGGAPGGFALTADGVPASVVLTARAGQPANLTVAVDHAAGWTEDARDDHGGPGASSLVLRSDGVGAAAVHVDAPAGGWRADAAAGIALATRAGDVSIDIGGGGSSSGGGMFRVSSGGGRPTFAVEPATGKMRLSRAGGAAGEVTLRNGTATVATDAVRRASLVFLTAQTLRCGAHISSDTLRSSEGSCGAHHVAVSRSVGRSFTVAALDVAGGVARGDHSTLAWLIVDVD